MKALQSCRSTLKVQRDFVNLFKQHNSLYAKIDVKTKASIGNHIRHILDHYANAFALMDLDCKISNYDIRSRNTEIDNDVDASLKMHDDLIQILNNNVKNENLLKPKEVIFQIDGAATEQKFETNALRELWFATHHGIHHNFTIKCICDNLIDQDELMKDIVGQIPIDFGKAPSTISYEHGI